MATNPFYTPITADQAGDALLKQQQQNQPATPTTPVPQQPGFLDTAAQTADQLNKENPNNPANDLAAVATSANRALTIPEPTGFWQKLSNDVVALGTGIPIAISHPLKTITGLVSTPEEPIGGGLLTSIKQVFDPQYYKDHPGLATFNTATWVAAAFSFGLTKVVGGMIEQGTKVAAEEAAVQGVDSAAVSSALKTSALRTAVNKGIELGDMGIVKESVAATLAKHGIEASVADTIASKVADSISSGVEANASKLKILNAGSHPLKTTLDAVGKVSEPIAKSIFGTPADTAVGKIYGSEVVRANPSGFANIENWASQQVLEKGLPDTIENRIGVMNDWSSGVSQWSLLSPEERVAYQENYIKASDMAQAINRTTGESLVPTKFLAPEYVDAIKQTISDAPASESMKSIIDELQTTYGNDIGLHRSELDAVIASNPTKEALTAAIESLGSLEKRITFSDAKLQAMADQLEKETGYRLATPPANKAISFAQSVEKAANPAVTSADIAGSPLRTRLGKMVDRIGLSPQGGIDNSIETLYQDQFTQKSVEDLSKYGNSIKVGTKTIPLDKLYNYLNANIQRIGDASPAIFKTKYTIADLNVADLTRLGVAKDVATDIVKIAKSSLTDIPFASTGLSNGIVNFMRARVPLFDSIMKTNFETHFNLSPFYATRYWFKTQILKGFEGGSVSFGAALDEHIQNVVQKLPYVKNIIAPKVGINEIKLMADEILYPLNKNILDYASNPDLLSLERSADLGKSIQSKNVFLRGVGYNIPYDATGLAKSLASKYGMSLEDALGYTIENGVKKYNNPEMFNIISDTTQAVFHYKPGILTSPLMKTINTIWFPARFESKVVMATAKWMGSLSPVMRLEVMSNWVNAANWSNTPDGIKWRQQNEGIWAGTVRYLLPYESIGETVASAMNGKLFGGSAGMLGGLPFGWVVNMMQDLALIPTDQQTNIVTGKVVPKTTPRNIVSEATASTVIEDLVIHLLPSIPAYTLLGGSVTPWDRTLREWTRGALSAGKSIATGNSVKVEKRNLERQFRTVPADYLRESQ